MDKPLTIRDLYKLCGKEIRAGIGDNVVMLSDDDEGNGYHHYCWYVFTPATDMGTIDCYGLRYCTCGEDIYIRVKGGEIEMLTWADILDMREDETYNPGLNSRQFNRIYDQARADVEQLMRFDGINLDCVETPEDEIESYCNKYGIIFDTHGNLIYREEVK